jgi:Flp pilus assembly protein TadD
LTRVSWIRALPIVLALLVTTTVFLPALQGQFLNWDDSTLFTKNPEYRGLGLAQLRWMFTTTLGGHYIPITWLTLGFNYMLGGMNPWGYHLLAILLHTLNAGLFYLVAIRLLGAAQGPARADSWAIQRSAAAVAALVFAIHPQRAESVAWITDRGTVVSAALYLLAVLAYLRAVEPSALRWRWWGVASLTAFAAALLSKGMVMSLPVTLLILDVYPLRRWRNRWRSAVGEKIPYAVVALLGAVVVLVARARGAQLSSFTAYGFDARIAFVVHSLWFYPSSLIWPAGLSPLYEVPARASVLHWPFWGAGLGLAVVTTLLFLLRHRFPGGLAAWIHSAAVVAPVSGIAHSGTQLVSDRYSYLAGLGFALIAGHAVAWAGRLRQQGRLSGWVSVVGAAGVGLVLAVLALGTWGQVGLWRNSETLWRWAAEQDPACATCYGGLGEAILYGTESGRARLDESEANERRAIALRPTLPLPHFILGTIHLVRGRYADAEASLKTYMQLAPGEWGGPARLALVYLVQDRAAEAVPLLYRAREMGPRSRPLGHADASELEPEFVLALRLLGDNREDLEYLGEALIQQGKSARAVPALRRAVELAPDAPGPRFWLIRAYQSTGQAGRAQEELAVLRRLDPRAAAGLPVR